MTIMTPNNIEVLLHFYTTSAPHPRRDAQAVINATQLLLEFKCIEPSPGPSERNCYRTTPLGAAWVRALCNVEMPTVTYVDSAGNIL